MAHRATPGHAYVTRQDDMKEELADMLICPVCKAELSLSIGKQVDGEILTGGLTCLDSGIKYPIEDGIPNLLPKEHQDPR